MTSRSKRPDHKGQVLSSGRKKRVLRRDNFTCHWCGSGPLTASNQSNLAKRVRSRLWWTIDHLICWLHGGTNDDDNLVAACECCNHARGAMTIEEFLDWIHDIADRHPRSTSSKELNDDDPDPSLPPVGHAPR